MTPAGFSRERNVASFQSMTTTTNAARWRRVRDDLLRAAQARDAERNVLLEAAAARTQIALLESLMDMETAGSKFDA